MLQATLAQLVFGRDMIMPVVTQANWELIRQRQQEQINRNNARENKDRVPHQYHVGDKVLLHVEGIQCKLSTPRTGPHKVIAVYDNGTVRIQQGAVKECLNIQRITPFMEKDED